MKKNKNVKISLASMQSSPKHFCPANFFVANWYNGTATAYHTHENIYEIFFTTQPNSIHYWKNEKCFLEKNTLCILPPKSCHSLTPATPLKTSRKISHFNLIIDCNYVDNFLITHNMHKNDFIESILNDGFLINLKQEEYRYLNYLAKQLTYYSTSETNYSQIINLFLYTAFSVASCRYTISTPSHSIESKIKSAFDNYEMLDQSIDSVCEFFGTKPMYIIAAFKKLTGPTIIQYRNLKRIDFAKNLLQYTDYSIVDISIKTGYFSSSHFGKNFKNIVGMSPLQYRLKSTPPND